METLVVLDRSSGTHTDSARIYLDDIGMCVTFTHGVGRVVADLAAEVDDLVADGYTIEWINPRM